MISLTNNLKTAALLAGLFGLLVWVGSFWGAQGMVIAGAFALAMNFSAWFFSDTIAIKSMRGVEATRESAPELVEMVERLARRAGLPMPKVYVCPHDAPNAFATGRNPRHAAVAFTAGILRLLNQEELEGVAAHELAHIKNRDTLISTVAATVAGVFSMMAQSFMFFGMGMGGDRRGGNPLLMLGVVILGAFGAAIIKAMISRSREFVADAHGAKIAGRPDGLMSALLKLHAMAGRVPMANPNPALNNLFIVEPFVGRALTRMFASHPPAEARIQALQQAR